MDHCAAKPVTSKGAGGRQKMEKLWKQYLCMWECVCVRMRLQVRLWGETQAWSKCHQRASLEQLERLRVVIFILWAVAGRWTGRENICNFMVSSGEI